MRYSVFWKGVVAAAAIALSVESSDMPPGQGLDKNECMAKGGVYFGDVCLTFSEDELSWFDAIDQCIYNGGLLAPLINIANSVNYYIKTNIGSGSVRSNRFWAGGSDLANHGTWRWITGQLFESPFPWGSGDPNSSPEHPQHCLLINYHNWIVDAPCDYKQRYICHIGIP